MKLELDALKLAREILDRTYIKWTTNDGKGGHCALGALIEANASYGGTYSALMNFLADIALTQKQFSKYQGKSGRRKDGGGDDEFNAAPIVYLNNQVGKVAVLKLFDAGIKQLQKEEKLA